MENRGNIESEMIQMMERQAIVDVLVRYATALDSRDWSLLETCFTPDAVADYGEGGIHNGFPDILKTVRFFLDGLDASHHQLGNFVIRLDGDMAASSCYLTAEHYLAETEGGDIYTVGGIYEDDLVKTADGWRIKHRKLNFTWTNGNKAIVEASQKKAGYLWPGEN